MLKIEFDARLKANGIMAAAITGLMVIKNAIIGGDKKKLVGR